MGNDYQRLFYIFQNMDNDFGNPTGYIKVEIIGGTAKLQLSLNNLINKPGIRYQLYGIGKSEQKLEFTEICDIQNTNGRADIKISQESSGVGASRLRFDDINVWAVIARLPGQSAFVSCPLVAYKSGEVKWKREFEAALSKPAQALKFDRSSEITMENKLQDSAGKQPIADDKPIQDNSSIVNILNEEMLENDEAQEETVGDISDLVDIPEMAIQQEQFSMEAKAAIQQVPAAEPAKTRQQTAAENGHNAAENQETGQINGFKTPIDKDILTQKENSFNNNMREITSKFEATMTSIYSKDNELTREREEEHLTSENDIIDSAERDFMEISSVSADGDRARNELDINRLREELDKSFEVCNPFNSKSRRFKWWKINSPGYLNNILFRNNVKTYLLFNPKVMLANYKYRYIIFGIRYDKYSGRERFICGVPGVYSIDENPFGNMGSWSQLEGYKPKYGAFGYWIILIDPRTGKLIKIK